MVQSYNKNYKTTKIYKSQSDLWWSGGELSQVNVTKSMDI